MAQPLLREAYEKRQAEGKRGEKEGELMSKEEAMAVMRDCMKVLYYRDARSLNKVGTKLVLCVVLFAWLIQRSWPRSVPNRNHHFRRRGDLGVSIE